MGDGDVGDRPAGQGLFGHLPQLPLRHLGIGVVLQVEDAATVAVVADDTQEEGDGAAVVAADVLEEGLGRQRPGGDLNQHRSLRSPAG